ncbi:MAG TPA: SRPBCC family protein [Gemmatimonadales bacterium]|jgi:uncharacterized protein YndB with AHSA1/START domain
MNADGAGKSASTRKTTQVRQSDRELVVTRQFDAPARLVFKAWTSADLFKQWWAPKSFGINMVSCEIDARTGGGYKMVFSHPASGEPMAFFGKYIEVTPPSRLVWTNEEAGDAGQVTTVTFEAQGGKTLVVVRELFPSKEALDEAIASGSVNGWSEQFVQLDEFLATQGEAAASA